MCRENEADHRPSRCHHTTVRDRPQRAPWHHLGYDAAAPQAAQEGSPGHDPDAAGDTLLALVAHNDGRPRLVLPHESKEWAQIAAVYSGGALDLDGDLTGAQDEIHLEPGLRATEVDVVGRPGSDRENGGPGVRASHRTYAVDKAYRQHSAGA